MTPETTSIEDKLGQHGESWSLSRHLAEMGLTNDALLVEEAISTIKELRENQKQLRIELGTQDFKIQDLEENGKKAVFLADKYYEEVTGYGPASDDIKDDQEIRDLKEFFSIPIEIIPEGTVIVKGVLNVP